MPIDTENRIHAKYTPTYNTQNFNFLVMKKGLEYRARKRYVSQ